MVEKLSLSSKIEAVLYLKGQPLSVSQLAEYVGGDRQTIKQEIKQLMTDYTQRQGALEIADTPDGYVLQLRPAFQGLVETLIPLDLGVALLRTLAAIALKGPIVQTELVDLRGSGAYNHVGELVNMGFVRKRRQADGRSYWLQVTDKFYQYFQVDALPHPFDQAQTTKTASEDTQEG
ncbi:MAG: SMC-Scp complex subunit ScpB [Leptolyngbyaceae bacterium]|nr:SMC-Scp complex subunit ScpB [Leptolyngbyaceae bacterium]